MSAAAQSGRSDKSRSLLLDRRIAAGILALVILIFTPLGARMSLKRAVDSVEEQFFTGVGPYGATADFLGDAENASLGLISVAAKYDAVQAETAQLRTDRSVLMDRLNGGSVSEIADANVYFRSSFYTLRDALLSQDISDSDAEELSYYVSQFEAAQGAVDRSNYNEAADEFTQTVYDRFPTGIVGSALGVDPPERFN